MKITVIIPTYNRPECIRENLSRLAAQDPAPDQVVVVDASPDDRTQRVTADFDGVLYLGNPSGRGNTPSSRNLALRHATGDILAFLDDDAYVHPGYTAALLRRFADPQVAGVAGRALNGQPGEERVGVDRIGRYLPDGRLTGNFAADPGKVVEVDHMIGCNMALRADVVGRLGGFRDDMRAGPFGICEETEIAIRGKRLGYRYVFDPAVCADHVGARQPGGRRFSPRYTYYHAKNNLVMVIRNDGLGTRAACHVASTGGRAALDFGRKLAGAAAHFGYNAAGLLVGLVGGAYWLARTGTGPTREDGDAAQIRRQLSRADAADAADAAQARTD